MSSTPTSSPSISSTELYSPARTSVDLVHPSEVFSKCKELMNSSVRQGRILNWVNRSVSKPLVWLWPLNENGDPFPASMLDWAYKHYEFTPPCCPCNTQDPNPHALHFAKIWVVHKSDSPYHRQVVLGCQGHYTGCGIFVPLEKMVNDSRLLTARYPRRHTLKSDGLTNFDTKGLLQPWETDPYMPRPQTLVPSTPSPPSRFLPPARKSGFSTPRGQKRTSNNLPMLPFLLSSPKKTRNSPDCSDNEVERILTFPPCGQPRATLGPSSSPVSSDSNSSVSIGRGSTTKNVEPSERWFGDTSCLFEPPEPSYAIQKNSEIPPLAGEDLMSALMVLNSGEGLVSDSFWRLYDKCDCSLWIRKDMLKTHLERYCRLFVAVSPPPAVLPANSFKSPRTSSSIPNSQAGITTPVIHRPRNTSPTISRHPRYQGTVSYIDQMNEATVSPSHSNIVPAAHSPLTSQRSHHNYMSHASDSQGESPVSSLWDAGSAHHNLIAYLNSGPAYYADQLELNVNRGHVSPN